MADQKNNNPKKPSLNIELDADVAQGIYSNLAIINHSQSEFVVDFVSIMPGVPKSKVKSRIVRVPMTDWEIAVFMPTQQFVKVKDQSVWRYSRDAYKV